MFDALRFHFFSFSFLFSYIDIIQTILEVSSKIRKFLCKENLTQFLRFFTPFGTRFACGYPLGLDKTRHKSLYIKGLRQIWPRVCVVSPYATRVYDASPYAVRMNTSAFVPLSLMVTSQQRPLPSSGRIPLINPRRVICCPLIYVWIATRPRSAIFSQSQVYEYTGFILFPRLKIKVNGRD